MALRRSCLHMRSAWRFPPFFSAAVEAVSFLKSDLRNKDVAVPDAKTVSSPAPGYVQTRENITLLRGDRYHRGATGIDRWLSACPLGFDVVIKEHAPLSWSHQKGCVSLARFRKCRACTRQCSLLPMSCRRKPSKVNARLLRIACKPTGNDRL